jgi:large subunit ribosomal protein L19
VHGNSDVFVKNRELIMPAKSSAKSSAKAATTTDLVRRVTWDRAAANKKALPKFKTGDSIGVYVKVKEGEKERVQLFAGVVLKIQGSGIGRTFTVRKIASGVGVERTFPMLSPVIDRVEVISHGKVRRSRLFYLRGLKGRSARLTSETHVADEANAGAADDLGAEAPAAAEGDAAPAQAKAEKKEKKEKPAKA